MRTRIGSTGILGVMIAMFLVELARGAVGNDAGLLRLGALPDSGLIHHEYWRLITCGFLHWDLRHLLL
jgi:membrane associated rhomboid family serine protease